MKIGIDAFPASRLNKTGTDWYAYNLIKFLAKIDHNNEYLLYTNRAFDKDLADLPKNFIEKKLYWPFPTLWSQGRLLIETLLNSPDILFVPADVVPLIHPKKTIAAIHDVGFLDYRENYSNKDYSRLVWSTKYALKHAIKIITISEFSRHQLIAKFNANPEKLVTIHLGINKAKYKRDINEDNVKILLDKYNIQKPYLLYIGRIDERKNILGLAEAFKMLTHSHPDLSLVLVGRLGHKGNEIINTVLKNKKIIYSNWIGEEEKIALLSRARAFIFPSFYEGFGLPILEAQALDCPVACSGTTSLPEVAGNGAIFFNPNSAEDMASKISDLLNSSILAAGIVKNGHDNLKNYSWEKCAKETLELLESV